MEITDNKRNFLSNINPNFVNCSHRCIHVVGENIIYCVKCKYNWTCSSCAKKFKKGRELEVNSIMSYKDALYCYYIDEKCSECSLRIHYRYR